MTDQPRESYPKPRINDLLSRRNITFSEVVRIVEVGSTAHGISSSQTGDDFDAMVIRIEPFTELVVGSPNRQSLMIRTQPEGIRSRMGDIDLQVYTLRKFVGLAAKGNPSILGGLFSQAVHYSALDLDPIVGMVASKRAGSAFLGYMRQQLERWQGVRGQKNVKRPELVDAYGYDTKYAAHVIRLGHQGIEYVTTGRYSMPLSDELAARIVDVREGRVSEIDALAWAEDVEQELLKAIAASPLPAGPAIHNLNRWTTEIYERKVGGVR